MNFNITSKRIKHLAAGAVLSLGIVAGIGFGGGHSASAAAPAASCSRLTFRSKVWGHPSSAA